MLKGKDKWLLLVPALKCQTSSTGHLFVKHGQQGDQNFNGQRSNFGHLVFSKRDRISKKKMIESIYIKKWCLVIGGQREKYQFFHMKLYYRSAFNQAIEVAADFQRFLAFLWSLKNQCLRSVSREKFAGEEVRKKFRSKFPPGGCQCQSRWSIYLDPPATFLLWISSFINIFYSVYKTNVWCV